MRYRNLFIAVSIITCGSLNSGAQTSLDLIRERPVLAAGMYHSYDSPDKIVDTPAPRGYKAVYVSHYGRHGSRFHSDRQVLANTPYALMAAHSKGLLTPTGEALLADLNKLVKANAGMTEELSLRGVHEHEGIARRLAARYPTVFRRDSIRSISSNYSRCIMSMMSFTGTLRSVHPGLKLAPITGEKYFNLVSRELADKDAVVDLCRKVKAKVRDGRFNPDRFVNSLFKEVPANTDAFNIAQSVFLFGCISECAEENLGEYVDIFHHFTAEELQGLWSLEADRYIQMMCANDVFFDKMVSLAKPLLKDIVVKADNALRTGSNVAADLRFGHDNGLTPLTFIIGIAGRDKPIAYNGSYESFPSFRENPMASNLQLVFYKAKGKEDLVKVLYNEKETTIPALTPLEGPYYKWIEVREHFLSKCGNAPSVDQLAPKAYEKINTYIGQSASLQTSALQEIREHLVLILPSGYSVSKVMKGKNFDAAGAPDRNDYRNCIWLTVSRGDKEWKLTAAYQNQDPETGDIHHQLGRIQFRDSSGATSDPLVKIQDPSFDPAGTAARFAEFIQK